MSRLPPATLPMLAAIAAVLSGCHGNQDSSVGGSESAGTTSQTSVTTGPARAASGAKYSIADGPDVCFRAIAKHLGSDVKVSEINAFFSSGSEIDSSDEEPKGQMTVCSVQYQNPADARKLLSTQMNMQTGEFGPPGPVEITVSSGDAASFKLEDFLIPLSKVNAAGLAAVMEAQKAKMGAIYSKYAWSGVRLESPDSFSNVHTLRLDIEGRLATNDIKEGGYMSLLTDGHTVKTDMLKP